MSTPTYIRSTAGFRFAAIYELVNGLPLGSKTLTKYSAFTVSGSTISGSSVSIPEGTAVSGSVGYYGGVISGAKVMTINDPAPRIIPHIGDDAVFSLQILPPTEPVNGEIRIDKTNDTIDSVVGDVNRVTIGEFHIMGQSTNKRGFENQVGLMAYSAAQDTDPGSTTFGKQEWDFRIMPKATVYQRDTGYQQEANERMYTVAPAYCTAHIWGTQFTIGVDGYTIGQLLRGLCEFKPVIVGFIGDGSTVSFPFDIAKTAYTVAKVNVWVNGVLTTTGLTKSTSGIVFDTAPLVTDIITVFYETAL